MFHDIRDSKDLDLVGHQNWIYGTWEYDAIFMGIDSNLNMVFSEYTQPMAI